MAISQIFISSEGRSIMPVTCNYNVPLIASKPTDYMTVFYMGHEIKFMYYTETFEVLTVLAPRSLNLSFECLGMIVRSNDFFTRHGGGGGDWLSSALSDCDAIPFLDKLERNMRAEDFIQFALES